jgi:hypothetical protein
VTPALLDRPALPIADPAQSPTRVAGPNVAAGRVGGGGVTLEERLNSALHEARTNGSTDCPVCHARMTRAREGAPHGGASCCSCGSRLT